MQAEKAKLLGDQYADELIAKLFAAGETHRVLRREEVHARVSAAFQDGIQKGIDEATSEKGGEPESERIEYDKECDRLMRGGEP